MSKLADVFPGLVTIAFIVGLILFAKNVKAIAAFSVREMHERRERKLRGPGGLTPVQAVALAAHARNCPCGRLAHISLADAPVSYPAAPKGAVLYPVNPEIED